MKVPANLADHYRAALKAGVDMDALFHDFTLSGKERFLRLYAAPALNLIPTKARYFITDIAKRLRNPSKELRVSYPLDFEENRKILATMKGKKKNPWWNKRAVLCLSHDVDNDEGYAFTSEMAAMDKTAGIPSTFNFLTHDNYNLKQDIMEGVHAMGHEIGLHGYTHDQGFAFRAEALMKKRLGLALEKLKEFSVTGTRTPALSKSETVFRTLAEAGIRYDSSLQTGSTIYSSVKVPYPYYFTEFDLWEIPLTIQDDNYLRDAKVSEEEMLSSILRFARETSQMNGVMVLNVHPHLMHGRKDLYVKLLDTVRDLKKDMHVITTGGLYRHIKDHAVEIKK